MKIFLTGATGFIGSRVAERLAKRGDHVKALVRTPDKAGHLRDMGCELVQGSLSDEHQMQAAMVGCDAVIHGAAVYSVGIADKDRQAMFDANVRGTERVLRAALQTEVPKVVYISTVNAFGNTEGKVVDETHEHHERYVSYYDETKHKAHRIAKILIEEQGLPCVIVQPGLVYGPGDTSESGRLFRLVAQRRMPVKLFPGTGVTASYIDDVADGIVAALDKGTVGHAYVLGGEPTTMGAIFDLITDLQGRKPLRFSVPVGMLRATAPAARFLNPMMGFPPNVKEQISAAHDVTYWASSDKAISELGYNPRPLKEGIKELLASL